MYALIKKIEIITATDQLHCVTYTWTFKACLMSYDQNNWLNLNLRNGRGLYLGHLLEINCKYPVWTELLTIRVFIWFNVKLQLMSSSKQCCLRNDVMKNCWNYFNEPKKFRTISIALENEIPHTFFVTKAACTRQNILLHVTFQHCQPMFMFSVGLNLTHLTTT